MNQRTSSQTDTRLVPRGRVASPMTKNEQSENEVESDRDEHFLLRRLNSSMSVRSHLGLSSLFARVPSTRPENVKTLSF